MSGGPLTHIFAFSAGYLALMVLLSALVVPLTNAIPPSHVSFEPLHSFGSLVLGALSYAPRAVLVLGTLLTLPHLFLFVLHLWLKEVAEDLVPRIKRYGQPRTPVSNMIDISAAGRGVDSAGEEAVVAAGEILEMTDK